MPETQYAQSGELSIAYQCVGDGPLDLLFIPGFVSNVELMWDIPKWADLFTRFSELGRFVFFDKRGTGCSDRTLGTGSAEDRMDDAEPELSRAIDLAGTAMPQVTIAALVASAVGLARRDPVQSVARAREALAVEAQTDIMPWFRVVAANIIAWHWAREARAEDAALALAAMDEMSARLGFAGIWWARRIRDEAWDAVRQALPADRELERTARGKMLGVADVRRLLGVTPAQ